MRQVISYGGGTNSAAMLVGLYLHGERPDAILFADTGGEKPHTYGHLWTMQAWCESVGFPSIIVVRGSGVRQLEDGSLEGESLRVGTLPSKAYGFARCSDKWKIRPQNKWIAEHFHEKPRRLIGFHAGEAHRADKTPDAERPYRRYPLIEWDWDYEECAVQIIRAGLPLPGKSACFFCPSSTKREILALRDTYPDLMARALEMERRALAGEGTGPPSGIGLGRYFTWATFLKQKDSQPDLFISTPEQCGEACFT